jgi:GNAT superfamily N-acetyltransferase
MRHKGVTRALLTAAVDLAREQGARALEAFPYKGDNRQSRDTQVGFESTYAALGFKVIREPSPSRVVMRLELGD